MKLESKARKVILTLEGDEARLLRIALERATFVDTRPEDQEAVYRFADGLATALRGKEGGGAV